MAGKIALIIQARMGSRRLPGKSMMDLAGAPLVGRIIERVQRCSTVDEVLLAVPNTRSDRILVSLGRSYGVSVYVGAEDDVLDRYYKAALAARATFIVRLPGDNPMPEPEEIDRIVDHHISLGRPGFSSNLSEIRGSGYPDGIGAEIFDFSILAEARSKNPSQNKREHVHLNFYDYSTGIAVDEFWCPISTTECPRSFRRPDLILDVNTPEQYLFIRQAYEYLYPKNKNFHITDTICWYDEVFSGQANH